MFNLCFHAKPQKFRFVIKLQLSSSLPTALAYKLTADYISIEI